MGESICSDLEFGHNVPVIIYGNITNAFVIEEKLRKEKWDLQIENDVVITIEVSEWMVVLENFD